MRIQHNIMAMNAYRNYNNNTSALSSNLEKLSSGYKINRAGDDAAGLAISEKMRAQISGLDQAASNVKDGISLVKTGEGALQEVQDMLNRMVTLATQSANGTYDDDVDRDNLQKEVDQLTEEINRIADSSNFNGISLLNGNLDSTATLSGADATPSVTVNTTRGVATSAADPSFKVSLNGLVFDAQAASLGANATAVQVKVLGMTVDLTANAQVATNATLTVGQLSFTNATLTTTGGFKFQVKLTGDTLEFTAVTGQAFTAGMKLTAVAVSMTVATGVAFASNSQYNPAAQVVNPGAPEGLVTQAQAEFNLTADMLTDGGQITIGSTTYTVSYATKTTSAGSTIGVKDLLDSDGKFDSANLTEAASRLTQAAAGNSKFTVGHNGKTITYQSLSSTTDELDTEDKVKAQFSASGASSAGKGLTLQIGDTSDSFNKLTVSIQDMHADKLGIDKISIASQSKAQLAIDTIKKAINTVSSTRGTLGATQNRLEHTQNNLSVMSENIQDAESTIRDTDVAEEMMSYTKNNILVQSAQAMLAQANSVPQGVLQLLQ